VSVETITYIVCVYILAGLIKGFSGLGFSAISISVLAVFFDLTVAIPLVVLPSVASCLMVMIEAKHFREAVRRFWPMYLSAIPGLMVGIWLLVRQDDQFAKAFLGLLLLVYAVWGLAKPGFTLSRRLGLGLRMPIGLVTGVFSGFTGVAVMPVTPYLLSLGLKPQVFVQALNISFVISSVTVIAGLGGLGYLETQVMVIAAAGILPVGIAVKYGAKLRKRASDRQFKLYVLLILMLLGLNLVVLNFSF
jgi:uncharacterized membrane protein YfcA